ncbi:hypothetical protein L9F63_018312 [Diploptera punctata]|uniref:Uncharacterized protein n=1 Tax=Diploptera punctata TaxID=6984 RepID=A0AAD8EFV8_DIPPU|nr:hypothetical protein L9F63_018312 [Diploptera punctata]
MYKYCNFIFTKCSLTGEDKRIRIWDLAAGTMLTELKGHSHTVLGLAWSRDGECLASCGLDNAVRVWNVKSRPNISSDTHTSPELVASYTTGCSSLLSLHYSHTNTLVCVGIV